MNISKFSPLHGAPIWDECISGIEGELHEDWRLMNCVNFVCRKASRRAKRWTPRLLRQQGTPLRQTARSLEPVARPQPETIAAARYLDKLHPRLPAQRLRLARGDGQHYNDSQRRTEGRRGA
jgi:anaerobic magnesium-protoporphyrin IX monomethyl ester cyclase